MPEAVGEVRHVQAIRGSRFMAVGGVALSAVFVTAILVQSIPPLFLRLCE